MGDRITRGTGSTRERDGVQGLFFGGSLVFFEGALPIRDRLLGQDRRGWASERPDVKKRAKDFAAGLSAETLPYIQGKGQVAGGRWHRQGGVGGGEMVAPHP